MDMVQKDLHRFCWRVFNLFIVLAVFGLIMFGLYKKLPYQRIKPYDTQYNTVFFGDSIIGDCRDETSIISFLTSFLSTDFLTDISMANKDINIFNATFGGTCMGYTSSDYRLPYTKDCMNMIGLSQAIYAGDFRVQYNAYIKEPATDYFEEVVYHLSLIDFRFVDTIFIGQCLNDYHAGVPIENSHNLYDAYTFAGALRTVVKNFRKINPDIKIVLVTPTFTWYIEQGLNCEQYDLGGGTLDKYVEKEFELADELDLCIIDLYHNLYQDLTGDLDSDWSKYTNDGIHPNLATRKLIAEKIAEWSENR